LARSAQQAWRSEHPDAVIDRADFLATITPRLKEIPLRQIMQAAGVTKATASGYRNGKSVPHPSYWAALAELVGVEVRTNQQTPLSHRRPAEGLASLELVGG
jgi:transcriptional regulator with XRE-family HTH domain